MRRGLIKVIKLMLGVMLLLFGLGIFFYPTYREWQTKKVISSIGSEMNQDSGIQNANMPEQPETKVNEESETEIKEDLQTLFASESDSIRLYQEMEQYNIHLLTEGQTVLDAWSFKQNPIDLSGFNSSSGAIGTIELPDIELTLPLYLGASEENMSKGAVVLGETSMPIGGINTNCVICAHRGWSGSAYFRDIDQLKTGSLVIIQNPWEKLIYSVTGTEIIHATENEILNLQPGKDMITLFSCYPYMQVGTKYRQVIFCERTEAEEKQTEGTIIEELAREDMAEKGIVIENTVPENLSEYEDMLRIVLPVMILFLCLLLILKRDKSKKNEK